MVTGPGRTSLYDAARDLHYVKPTLRGWSHLLWFAASLVAGTLLIISAKDATETAAAAIYAGTVSGLFGISALYHRGNWSPPIRAVLQRVDHAMIFFLIAGTATPAFLLSAPASYGRIGLAAMWALTLTLTAIHLAWMRAPEKLVGTTFIGLGVLAGVALPSVWVNSGVVAAALMLAGGLFYLAGALAYHRRRPDPAPTVFGYHEVFHACVCAAAACHYIAIALFIL
ncbi:MAG: hemolysin III family protein [Actinomycetota bacterium]